MSDPHAHATSHAQSELDADEPRTPLWLPLLGGALFLSAAIFALATSSNEPPSAPGEPATTAAADVAPPAAAQKAPAPAGPHFNVRRVPEGSIERVAPPPSTAPAPRMLQPGVVPPRNAQPPGAARRAPPPPPPPPRPPRNEPRPME